MLYVFYWGEHPSVRHRSPVLLLAEALYEYARELGAKVLDIGTATVDSVPNQGLMDFKRQIGCQASLKVEFVRDGGSIEQCP